MAMQIGMGFGKFLARVLFQELGVSVPSSVFHVLFITRSLHATKKKRLAPPACSELPERARMDTSFPARVAVACVAWDGTRPADTESSTAGAGGRLQSAIIVRRRD